MLKKLVNTWGTSGICFETSKAYDALVGHSLVSDTMLYPLLTLSIFRRSLKHQGCIRHVMFDNSTEHTHQNSQLTRDMFIVQTIKSMMLLVMCLYMLLTVDFLDVPKSDSLVLFLTWMLSLFREWAYRITNLKTFIYNLRKCWMSASFFLFVMHIQYVSAVSCFPQSEDVFTLSAQAALQVLSKRYAINLVGGWPTPLKNMKVSREGLSPAYHGK